MTEPLNSWEVSYVLGLKRPDIKTGISMFGLNLVLDYKRREELYEWAEAHYNKEWLYEHTQ